MPALVGNDVVDLLDPDNARSFRRPGYVERVCAAAEQSPLARSSDPERLFWTLYAAKEAAYKLLVKLGASPGFAHRELVVGAALDGVEHRGRQLGLSVSHGPGFVHATASIDGVRPRVMVAPLSGDASLAVRALGRALVARAAGCRPSEVEIERSTEPGTWDGRGPPFATRAGAPMGLDVSLSHDGRFVAAAVSAHLVAPLLFDPCEPGDFVQHAATDGHLCA